MIRTDPVKELLTHLYYNPSKSMDALFSISRHDEKTLVKAGLLAWMFFPLQIGRVESAARLRAAVLLGSRYRSQRRECENPLKAIEQMLAANRNHWLLKEFFGPLGGLTRLAEARSRKSWTSDIRKSTERFKKLLPVLKVIHVYCEHTKGARPSLERALGAVEGCRAILQKPADGVSTQLDAAVILAERALKDHWAEFQPSLPFLYAAYLSEVKGKGNFLEFISNRPFGGPVENAMLGNLLSRARFVHELIFARFPNAKAAWDVTFPSAVEPIGVPPPTDYLELAPHILSAWQSGAG